MVESRLKTRLVWKKTLFHCLLCINILYSLSVFLFTSSLRFRSLPFSSLSLFFLSLLSLKKCDPKILAAWILTNPSTTTSDGGLLITLAVWWTGAGEAESATPEEQLQQLSCCPTWSLSATLLLPHLLVSQSATGLSTSHHPLSSHLSSGTIIFD